MAHPHQSTEELPVTRSGAGCLLLLATLVALLWVAVAFTAYTQHETTRHTTNQFRLLNLSSYAVSAATNLRNELHLLALSAMQDGPGKMPADAARKLANSRTAIENFEKNWGRFNAAPYGQEFLDRFSHAIDLVNRRAMALDKTKLGPQGIREAHFYTADVISQLYRTLQQFNEFEQAEPRYKQSIRYLNANLSSAMRLEELARTFLSADRSSNNVETARKTLDTSLADLKSTGFASQHGQPVKTTIKQADALAKRMLEEISSNRTLDASSELKWIEEISALDSQLATNLHQLATTIYEDSQKTALQSHYLVVLTLFLALLASIVLLTWLAPDHYSTICIGALLIFDLGLIYWSRLAGPDFLAWERGPMEFLQAVALAVAFALFSLEVARSGKLLRMAAIPFVVICFVMFFREFDFRIYGGPDWLVEVTTGIVRRVVNASLLAAVTIYLLWNYRGVRELIRENLRPRVWPLVIWPLLLVAGEYIEHLTHETRKDSLPGFWEYGQFWEEFMELNGYLVLLYGATIFTILVRDPGHRNSSERSSA